MVRLTHPNPRWGIGLGKKNPRAVVPSQWRGKNWLRQCLVKFSFFKARIGSGNVWLLPGRQSRREETCRCLNWQIHNYLYDINLDSVQLFALEGQDPQILMIFLLFPSRDFTPAPYRPILEIIWHFSPKYTKNTPRNT